MDGTATSSSWDFFPDGRLDLAKDMVKQLLFEVEHYGAVLNASDLLPYALSAPLS